MDLRAQKQEWTRQGIFDDSSGTYGEQRLTEMISLYKELGFDVRIEPVELTELVNEAGCSECIKENISRYKVLYTKKIDAE